MSKHAIRKCPKPAPFEPCRRPCVYHASLWDGIANKVNCDYFAATGKSRVLEAYKRLGVDEMTDEARELLRPKNCPCFKRDKHRKGGKRECI